VKRIKTATILLSVILLIMSGSAVLGQTSFGSVSGTVSDSSGGRVPGAEVTLINQLTNIRAEAITNDSGFYRFVNVRPGAYVVTITFPGFKTVQIEAFDVRVNDAVVRNAILEVGEVTERLEIVAGTQLIQVASAELGNVIEEKVIKDLPLNGRNFTQLLLLTPGVNPVSTAQGSQTTISFGAAEGNTGLPGSTIANASIQGQQNRSKVYYIDGIINTSVRANAYVVLPDIDSLQEFKVQSHNDKAEYGGVTGGVINMISKSGTNEFHGSAFQYVRNEMFDARDPFRDRFRDKPFVFRQNQFGANMGGPIIKNKTFFFAGYDGWRYRDVANIQFRIPTEREINGDFSQSYYTLTQGRRIFNPYSTRVEDGKLVRDEFPNRIIPANLISPKMQGFVKAYMYKPNVPGADDPANFTAEPQNFRLERARENNANAFMVRLDHHFSQNDNVFFRWNEQYVSSFNPQGDRGARTPDATNRNFGGGWLHSFSPSLILEIRGGKATQPTEDAPFEHELGADPLKQLGFPELDRFGGYVASMSGNPWMNQSLGVQGPRPRGNPNWNLMTDLTWLRGNHSFKTGFQFVHISRLQKNQFGEIRFNQVPTQNPQQTGGTGDDLASLLLGLPWNIRGYVHDYGFIDFGTGTASGYFQDEWKILPDLSLTFGLRYDYITKAKSKSPTALQSGPDMNTGKWLIALKSISVCNPGDPPPCLPAPLDQIPFNEHIVLTGEPYSILKSIRDNWGPRVGLAWQVNNKTALRTAYSLVWDALPSRSQYGQHQYETWGWPQFSGIDTGAINLVGGPIQSFENIAGLPFAGPRPLPWNSDGYFNDPNRKDAYSHQWHVEIQREVRRDLMFSVAYVGSENGRLEYAGNAAASPVPGVGAAGNRLLPAAVNQLRPWPHITGTFTYSDDIGWSNYHSFQTKVQRRFSDGLGSLLSYTFQKSMDTSSGWFNAERGVGNSHIQNYHDPDSNRAVSGYDVPHLVTWATVWEFPIGKGRRYLNEGLAATVLGNWQMNWILLARSGQPITVDLGGDIANIGSTGTYMRPNLVGNPKLDNPNWWTWYNPDAFAIPVNSFGNAGRNILRTDKLVNMDFGLQKNLRISESKVIEFRAEAFNVFNQMSLGNPNTRIGQATTGRISGIRNTPRQMQFGLRFRY
jgi:hypothetical protein